ncbi:alpha/beta hydrolase [Streptomyces sp. E5N298]|uniref:alpha/beta fold hydrolase n=1 Tax=Streptomyces sp. E5N298 TaxID=1851983 RepID=UPI000EF5DAE8|nr:alpha/beta hydrolase [Streptomyces sp. E5N298]
MSERVSAAGQEVACVTSEGTGPAVVLVHGNSSSARVWRSLLDGPFGRRFRCLALDLPGHGDSARGRAPEDHAIPGYASVVARFVEEVRAEEAVLVGWSLGGHVVLEAAEQLPGVTGLVLFGAPPVSGPADFGRAFLPNPAMNVGFTAEVDAEAARSYAESFLAPGSKLPTDDLVADILATDGAARAGLLASIEAGNFADEVAVATRLDRPLAVLHGEGEQLVSLDYLRSLDLPTLWRGEVQVLPGVGHAPHVEAPERFADVLGQFMSDLV